MYSWLFQLSIIFSSPPNCIFILSSLAIHINFPFLHFSFNYLFIWLCTVLDVSFFSSTVTSFCCCCCAIWISCNVSLLKIVFLRSNEFISTRIENSERQITKCCNNELESVWKHTQTKGLPTISSSS